MNPTLWQICRNSNPNVWCRLQGYWVGFNPEPAYRTDKSCSPSSSASWFQSLQLMGPPHLLIQSILTARCVPVQGLCTLCKEARFAVRGRGNALRRFPDGIVSDRLEELTHTYLTRDYPEFLLIAYSRFISKKPCAVPRFAFCWNPQCVQYY